MLESRNTDAGIKKSELTLRRGTILESSPMRTSVFRLRSWASSMIMHEYCRSKKSDCREARRSSGEQKGSDLSVNIETIGPRISDSLSHVNASGGASEGSFEERARLDSKD